MDLCQCDCHEVNMRLNNNILQNYFAALNNQIIDIKVFHNQTEQLLSSDEITNLHAEDLARQVEKDFIIGKDLSIADKIFAILSEIAADSKTYLSKLSKLSPIFGNLMSTVNFAK